MDAQKRLVRPVDDRWVAGVCSGIARYFGLDPTLIRVVWILLICLAGTGILAYLICWLVVPSE
jgi:phage shock protein PspC (stress-responsive transcriptional regulator)